MNLYIIETIYHLFLTLIVVDDKDWNILIVDSHRNSTLSAVKYFKFILNKSFKQTIFVHQYRQIVTFNGGILLNRILYYLKVNHDVKKILQETESADYLNLFVFTPNLIERLLIKKIYKSNVNNNVINIEDGIGSYTIVNILGRDNSTSESKSLIIDLLRRISNTNLSTSYFKTLYFVFPDLVEDKISSSFQSIKMIRNFNSVLKIKNLISKDYFTKNRAKKNFNKSLHLFSKFNDEFEMNFNRKYFFEYQIDFKLHPSRMNQHEDNSMLNNSIELLSLVDPFNVLLSYNSSSALALLNIASEFSTKFIFLFEIYHSFNVRFNTDDSFEILFKLMKKFPKNIFIPKNLDELMLILKSL